MELKGKKINFLGDSITEGVGTSCVEAQKEMFCPDGLHPNDAGNVKIATVLKSFLENI